MESTESSLVGSSILHPEFREIASKFSLDILESINNTLKPLAKAALQTTGSALAGVARKFFEQFVTGAENAASQQGKVWGERIVKWVARIAATSAVAVGAQAVGLFAALESLAPSMFGWVPGVLRLLGLVV